MHDAFEAITEVATFCQFSTKRNTNLATAINRSHDCTSFRWKLQIPCKTRWANKHSAVLTVAELHNTIHTALLQLSEMENESAETHQKA